ncbi:MAG: L,D-transpeptidase family protein [Pyrinomonadaceae bacterium]
MKFVLTICLLLITLSIVCAQQRGKHTSLTRAQTREGERRLSDLGYWTGAIDGRFDPATRSALIAFQKWQGRPITGQLTPDELEAIRTSTPPTAREAGYAHAEVDLDRQVLLWVNDNGGVRVLPVSTGSDKPFVDEGQTSIAYTARGRFLVYDKEVGWGNGPLGSVYYANFISGGVAIHGSPSVPNQPASHGCIRIPMFAARDLSKLLPVGTIVLVYDKISFVSAKPWVENPELKQAALANTSIEHIDYVAVTKPGSKSFAKKRGRSRIIRAGLRNDPSDLPPTDFPTQSSKKSARRETSWKACLS